MISNVTISTVKSVVPPGLEHRTSAYNVSNLSAKLQPVSTGSISLTLTLLSTGKSFVSVKDPKSGNHLWLKRSHFLLTSK